MCTAKGRKCSAKIVRVLEKKNFYLILREEKKEGEQKEPRMQ